MHQEPGLFQFARPQTPPPLTGPHHFNSFGPTLVTPRRMHLEEPQGLNRNQHILKVTVLMSEDDHPFPEVKLVKRIVKGTSATGVMSLRWPEVIMQTNHEVTPLGECHEVQNIVASYVKEEVNGRLVYPRAVDSLMNETLPQRIGYQVWRGHPIVQRPRQPTDALARCDCCLRAQKGITREAESQTTVPKPMMACLPIGMENPKRVNALIPSLALNNV